MSHVDDEGRIVGDHDGEVRGNWWWDAATQRWVEIETAKHEHP